MDLPCFECGPIRPPSEARSLLVRVTRNCPWNRCTFCPVYKGQRFSLRSVDEIVADLDAMAAIAAQLHDLSQRHGSGGQIAPAAVQTLMRGGRGDGAAMQVALFLQDGGQSVFLQDANSLILPCDALTRVLDALRERFPTVRRVTSYARSHTVLKRSVAQLRQLRAAGLNRLHIGLESGSDRVLTRVEKGVTAENQIQAGQRVKAADIELSEYVMPGLGGRALSHEHAVETARVLRAIDPHFIRLRTFAVASGTPLAETCANGGFEPLTEVEVVRELHTMLSQMTGMTGYLASDHVLNLLQEVEGRLAEDLPAMLQTIERFVALAPQEQQQFVAQRRWSVPPGL